MSWLANADPGVVVSVTPGGGSHRAVAYAFHNEVFSRDMTGSPVNTQFYIPALITLPVRDGLDPRSYRVAGNKNPLQKPVRPSLEEIEHRNRNNLRGNQPQG